MRKLLIICSVVLWANLTWGQTELQLLPAEKKQQTLITQPITLYKGFYRVGLTAEYIVVNTLFNDDSEREARFNAIGDRWNFGLLAEYGITDRLQVAILVPYTNFEASGSFLLESPFDGTVLEGRITAPNTGFEDLQLSTAYQVIPETQQMPSITVLADVSLPTAEKNPTNIISPIQFDRPTGNGNVRTTISVNARKINYPFLFSGTASYRHQFKGNKVFQIGQPEISFRNAGVVTISGETGFHVNEWMAIINNVSYSSVVGDLMRAGVTVEAASSWFLNYSPTLTFQVKQLRINQFLTFPVIGRNTTADPRYQLGVQYVF